MLVGPLCVYMDGGGAARVLVEEVYQELSEVPVAAASLGQVGGGSGWVAGWWDDTGVGLGRRCRASAPKFKCFLGCSGCVKRKRVKEQRGKSGKYMQVNLRPTNA
jgi:hypothetical protein